MVLVKASISIGEPSLPTSRPPPAGPPWVSTEIRNGPSASAAAIAALTSSSLVTSVRA